MLRAELQALLPIIKSPLLLCCVTQFPGVAGELFMDKTLGLIGILIFMLMYRLRLGYQMFFF